jgi:amidase
MSSREVVQAHLDRIATENADVNAVVEVMADSALTDADTLDRELASGTWRGALHGVPITVKTNIDVAGSATSNGIVALRDAVAAADAPHVARLRGHGAVVMARTNMPDWAFRWHTDNALAGATRNPWDPKRTPGGSGGGDAAAVATGMTPLALGNDYGGSVRFPAQACGVAAMRPSRSLVPYRAATPDGELPFTIQLFAVQGFLARRVEDLATALDLVAGAHPDDPWSAPRTAPLPPLRRRVAVAVDAGTTSHPDVAAGVRRAATALAEQGYEVDEVDVPGIDEAAWLWAAMVATEARLNPPSWFDAVGEDQRRFLDGFLAVTPHLDLAGYARALADRQRVARRWADLQQRYPVVVGPVTAAPPFHVGHDLAGPHAVDELLERNQLLVGTGMLDLPAVVVPVGVAAGLPQSVQVIAPRGRDDAALDAATAIQRQLGTLALPPLRSRNNQPVPVP